MKIEIVSNVRKRIERLPVEDVGNHGIGIQEAAGVRIECAAFTCTKRSACNGVLGWKRVEAFAVIDAGMRFRNDAGAVHG